MVSDNQPASVEDLAVLTGSGSTGGIGGRPVSVEDLKLVAADMARTDVLFEGSSYIVNLSAPLTDYDYCMVLKQARGSMTTESMLFADVATYMANPKLNELPRTGPQASTYSNVQVTMNGAQQMSVPERDGYGARHSINKVLGIRLGGGAALS